MLRPALLGKPGSGGVPWGEHPPLPPRAAVWSRVGMGGKGLWRARVEGAALGLWSKALAAALAPRNSSQGRPWRGGGGQPREGHCTRRAIYGAGAGGGRSSRFGSRAACGRSVPGVRLPPGFSRSELVIQALTLPVASPRAPQPSRRRGGCSGARVRAPGGKPPVLQSCSISQLPAQFGQWGRHPPPLHRDIWVPDAL